MNHKVKVVLATVGIFTLAFAVFMVFFYAFSSIIGQTH